MTLKRSLIGAMIFFFATALYAPLIAQEAAAGDPAGDPAAGPAMVMRADPPMKNVFHNVLWGSMAGGLVFMGWSILDDSKPKEERYSFTTLTVQFITGATYGGLGGLGVGTYLSILGVSFDSGKSRIAHNIDYPGMSVPRASLAMKNQIPLMQYNYKF